MTAWLLVAAVYFGLLFVTAVVGTIAYDLVALRKGWRTVSEEIYLLSAARPWAAVVLTGCFAFALGVLAGHLFFAQRILP